MTTSRFLQVMIPRGFSKTTLFNALMILRDTVSGRTVHRLLQRDRDLRGDATPEREAGAGAERDAILACTGSWPRKGMTLEVDWHCHRDAYGRYCTSYGPRRSGSWQERLWTTAGSDPHRRRGGLRVGPDPRAAGKDVQVAYERRQAGPSTETWQYLHPGIFLHSESMMMRVMNDPDWVSIRFRRNVARWLAAGGASI